MKKLHPHRSLLFLSIFFFLVCLLPGTVFSGAKKSEWGRNFKGSPGWEKCDLRARQAFEEAFAAKDGSRRLEGMLKTKAIPTRDEQALLKGAGFQVRSMIGTIATGSMMAKSLPAVMGLQFVEVFELAVPLKIK